MLILSSSTNGTSVKEGRNNFCAVIVSCGEILNSALVCPRFIILGHIIYYLARCLIIIAIIFASLFLEHSLSPMEFGTIRSCIVSSTLEVLFYTGLGDKTTILLQTALRMKSEDLGTFPQPFRAAKLYETIKLLIHLL
jgi:hypothetical protein